MFYLRSEVPANSDMFLFRNLALASSDMFLFEIAWMWTLVLHLIRVVFQLVLKAMLFLECGVVIVKNYIALKLSDAVWF